MNPEQSTNPNQMFVPPTPSAAPAAQPTAIAGGVSQPASPQPPADPKAVQAARASAQNTLLISEIRDSMVIMKDGSFRAVITCQSINFDLMSEIEREAVEYSYQNFLNSLSYPTQILVRSQRVDIGPYIEKLSKIRTENDNMLLGILMDDYINFITTLSEEANIMDKSFFVCIPYFSDPSFEKGIQKTKNIFKEFLGSNKGPEITKIDRTTYEKASDELSRRCDATISGLMSVGLRAARLNTQQLNTLYYNFNNPETALREPLVDFSQIATIYVKKGEGPAPTPGGNR